MVKPDEIELFDYLSRQPKFRDWLNNEIITDTSVLMQATDIDQLRKAQGRCGLLTKMLTLLDRSPAALKR